VKAPAPRSILQRRAAVAISAMRLSAMCRARRRILHKLTHGTGPGTPSPPGDAGSREPGAGNRGRAPTPSGTRRALLQREYAPPVCGADREDGQAVAASRQREILERRVGLDLGQRDRARELALEGDVDEPPARIVTPALRVVVPGATVELGRVRARFAHDLHDADDARDLAARMVEERLVAGPHVAPHHVAHLEIAHS